jgi:peptidoglycan/LPS O-acetylase OafA/YrhL
VDSSTFAALCAFGVTIIISAISYRFLETPFLRMKSRFALIPSRPA